MSKTIFKYFSNQISSNPFKTDRLIVTSFLIANNLSVKRNTFLRQYVIEESGTSEFLKVLDFISIVHEQRKTFDLEFIIELFEFVISPSDRIVNGAVYTPKEIREFIVSKCFELASDNRNKLTVADMSSGCGGFLCTAAQKLRKQHKLSYADIFRENIFGLDIHLYSVTRTKILLSLLAISEGEDVVKFDFNMFEGDALEFRWTEHIRDFKGFDIVVGNPPYVCSRNINSRTKKLISNWEVARTGHPDLYIPFFQIGLENLTDNGVLGLITVNSFFKSLNGRALREYFQEKCFKIQILDFGTNQVFRSRNTYTCICLIEKKQSDRVDYVKTTPDQIEKHPALRSVPYSSLNYLKGWNLQRNETLSKIEATGMAFGDLYSTRNGIATLKNEIYIFNPCNEDAKYFYLQNGAVYKIEKTICKDIINPNKLGTVNRISALKQKIIFPYEYINGKAKIYSETFLEQEFPNTLKYLKAKKEILATRDKGKGDYQKWFAYGRNQSLEKIKHKLFFPHITDRVPSYAIDSDEDLLFYNGIAVVGSNVKELTVLKKLMQSKLFWFYITNSSKPYSSDYYSLSRTYIKNFGIYAFSEVDIDFIISERNQETLDRFFEEKYEIKI